MAVLIFFLTCFSLEACLEELSSHGVLVVLYLSLVLST